MNLEEIIKQTILEASKALYGDAPPADTITVQNTRKQYEGDLSTVVFPLVRFSKKTPEATGKEIGQYLVSHIKVLKGFNAVNGFLNLLVHPSYWTSVLNHMTGTASYGHSAPSGKIYVVEYSSPNTNKPLHLGHIRNNLIGFSLSRIFEANGHTVYRVNIVNDRGIHICKSMLAWNKWGKGTTPESTGKKGDHLVGDFYVLFEKEYKKEVEKLAGQGVTEEEARKNAPLILEAQEMLRKWEDHDPETWRIWEMMNHWVYQGFDETYHALGVCFDRIYYESQTYTLGREIVLDGLSKGVFRKHADGSVWVDLTPEGLDEKVLLRADGTSVYITQDLGTAHQRYEDYSFDKHIYVVGNEQIYHFQVLIKVLEKMGYPWAGGLYHLSYGMVELPEGKMKSREGTVVDADDLIREMISTATDMSKELGKLEGFAQEEIDRIMQIIGLGALKYFILKVDPRKNMLFNPRESIDFNGNTGPFLQYTYARIQSVFRIAEERGIAIPSRAPAGVLPNEKEQDLIKRLAQYPSVVNEAGEEYSPALIANYAYELVKEYNQFYHDFSILGEKEKDVRDFRMVLSSLTSTVIKSAMYLLGIDVPPRM
jgi:arginyl-tRNA synthetase